MDIVIGFRTLGQSRLTDDWAGRFWTTQRAGPVRDSQCGRHDELRILGFGRQTQVLSSIEIDFEKFRVLGGDDTASKRSGFTVRWSGAQL